jgi:hypothetical protein
MIGINNIKKINHKLESPRLIEITVESRVIKKIGELRGRMVIFLLRPNLFFGPLSLFWGTKNENI